MSRKTFIDSIESQTQFDSWYSQMDTQIKNFLQNFEDEQSLKLDYNIESIEIIENWLISKFSSIEEAYTPQGVRLIDGVSRFVGETFRKYFGGTWDTNIEDIEDIYYGFPCIKGFESQEHIFKKVYPLTWVTASINRRTGKFITERFDNHFKR